MIDAHHEIFVTDRIKELIKVRANQVAPSELEGHLLDHPVVTDVCVISIPDDYSGELPYAFVVPSSDALSRIKAGKEGQVRVEVLKVCPKLLRCHGTLKQHCVAAVTARHGP